MYTNDTKVTLLPHAKELYYIRFYEMQQALKEIKFRSFSNLAERDILGLYIKRYNLYMTAYFIRWRTKK